MRAHLIRFSRRFYHYAVYLVAGMFIVVSLAALLFKFWVMPRIDDFGPALERAAAEAVGQPVRIGRLSADWHGVNPRLTLFDVRVLAPEAATGESRQAGLTLPRVEAVLSWLSLPLLDAHLARLTLDRPSLDLRRDTRGVLFVAGIPVNVPSAPSPFPDWLLKQPRIVVRDAAVVWRDDLLEAPPLRFERVRLLLENRFGRHRFGGVALPDAAARGVEVRGDLKGDSAHRLTDWSGELYARVDDARFDTWGRWVPWAQQAVRAGVGDLRFWLTLADGEARGLVGDARLADVAVNLHPELPDMAFDSLGARVGWSREREVHTFFIDRLRFQAPDAATSEPAAVRVDLTPDGQGGFRRIGASVRNLRLEALTALAGAVPLPARGHDLVQALNPQGLIEFGEGHWASAKDYGIKLRMRAAGVQPYGDLPGYAGMSLRVRADQDAGEAELEGREALLQWPRVFRHELPIGQLDAKAEWRTGKQGTRVDFEVARVANTDLDGSATGRIDLPPVGAPVVDVSAHLTRGEASAVYRYLPRAVAEDAYVWLRRGLQGGHSDDVRLTLKGPLDRFPFDQGGGQFKVAVNMIDGVLDYAPGWPRIDGVRGSLVFEGLAMRLDAHAGRILDVPIGPVRAVIPDLHYSDDETVFIDGRASGETRAFLEFIRRSPVNAHTSRFTEPFVADGRGELTIKLALPVRNIDASTVQGNYAFQNNRLDLGGELPVLEQVGGVLGFTEKSLTARAIRANLFGQPANLDIDSQPGGQVRARMTGRLDAAALSEHLPAAIAGRLHGATGWRADVGMNADGRAELSVASDLRGLAIDLPAPFGKRAEQAVALSIARQPGDARVESAADQIQARYGDLASLRVAMPRRGEARARLRLGAGEAEAPAESGLWVDGHLPLVDLDAWRQSFGDAPAGIDGGPKPLPMREIAVTLDEARLYRRRLRDIRAQARPSGNGWTVSLASRDISGEIKTVPQDDGIRAFANFKRLALPEPEADAPPEPKSPSTLAGMELNAASFAWDGIEFGELRARLSRDASGLRLDNLNLKNPDGRLEGKGVLGDARRPTRLDLSLDSGNFGKLLARLGHPGRIKGGVARFTGTLGWPGGLEAFELARLDGNLEIGVKQGQFLKVEPGAGRLLGILSLQALPRRIALDFRDVFSEGFAFDEIAGKARLERGIAHLQQLGMNGPAARVTMSGSTDLARETQDLRVAIQPRMEESMAVAGALLGGPAVGLGTLIAGKVLKDPIGQVVAFEYQVTGTWAEPVVAKVPRARADRKDEPAD